MRRQVSSHLQLDVTEPALLALQITAATRAEPEQLTVERDGEPVPFREVATPHGGRLQIIDAPVGTVLVNYSATVDGEVPTPAGDELDRLTYLRPSRYCPSDRLLSTANAEFGHMSDTGEIVTAVARWVGLRLAYIVGSSGPTDDALDTLLLGEGVCRDYAHLVVGLLRAQDIPARLAAVYAPGLYPMDFHAVVEAWVDGEWRVVDATGLAPRQSLLRIATGRDAADTAFLSVHHGTVNLVAVNVMAVVDTLPTDDPEKLVTLG
ncbi:MULTISPECIES: transglutaminase family protein [unclassified Pseudonocardia]|jgi:transglutaminase-like putative cysteine protease|uniref:transglutaminase-like domain-containing protein n=1 Tax=unclassified Pseudonocardia TaxID=2619320 RepID=UPI000965327C|nr:MULTISPECIES: transglutaminase family protein [unclassified Pseudonocardia]MBN9099421.1 transglutaminase family protein [Pseudonocardia sp.]OJY48607.1 MAG: transglutaminase [Pseudonocardia sp. 73-21]